MRQAGISLKRRAVAAIALLGVAIAIGCNSDYRADVLQCEEAVARLETCCPGFQAEMVSCDYHEGGCNSGPNYPDIGESASLCIRDRSCDELVKGGECAHRMQASSPVALCGY